MFRWYGNAVAKRYRKQADKWEAHPFRMILMLLALSTLKTSISIVVREYRKERALTPEQRRLRDVIEATTKVMERRARDASTASRHHQHVHVPTRSPDPGSPRVGGQY